MSPSPSSNRYIRLALYIALASALQLCESFIPAPIAGFKIGFANIVTLIVLYTTSFSDALIVAVLRTIASSVLMGTFAAPAFVLSCAGATASALVMGMAYRLPRVHIHITIIGTSVLGAITHTLAQCGVAYFFIQHTMIFTLTPFLMLYAIPAGVLTGFVAQRVVTRQKKSLPSVIGTIL